MNRVLVIGIGNTLRSDDGAGVVAAERIGKQCQDVDVMTVQELLPEDAEEIARHEAVVFLDASVATDRVRVTPIGDPRTEVPLTHFMTPASVLELAQLVYQASPAKAVMIELPVTNVELGEVLTAEAERAVGEGIALFEKFYRTL
jgi:hydrogenase maturation protease